MKKVITYGTYDLLHYGHIRLLERAKALGDYLIVGVTAEDFDKVRGKINVEQSLVERMESVRATGLADEIIVEEYEGQKIDDIRRYDIDIFTVGSDWVGKFDYLNEYCEVVYLDRTEGVSSTEIRSEKGLRVGLVGYSQYIQKVFAECSQVNGINVNAIWTMGADGRACPKIDSKLLCESYEKLLYLTDAVYIHSHPKFHYDQVKSALISGKHVMCESPIARTTEECKELMSIAANRGLVLMDSLRTAYSTAYERMLLLVKSGRIGEVVTIDSSCTSLKTNEGPSTRAVLPEWGSMEAWGPTALLPILQILGTSPNDCCIASRLMVDKLELDAFSRVMLQYPTAIASAKVGVGVKSEGDLVVSGTEGYIYVPAPWWKTEYFELRYEDPTRNRRYFYQLEGEGVRYEWVAFVRMISAIGGGSDPASVQKRESAISAEVSLAICEIIDRFSARNKVFFMEGKK